MHQIAQKIPEMNRENLPLMEQKPPLDKNTALMLENRIKQLRALIDQSFDIFNLYGKSKSSAGSLLQGFDTVLEQYSIAMITQAFQEWMGKSSVMPTPSDILKICLALREDENQAKRIDATHQRLKQLPPPSSPKKNAVPWACKQWIDFTDADKSGLLKHFSGMSAQKSNEYKKYLNHQCGVPMGFMNTDNT